MKKKTKKTKRTVKKREVQKDTGPIQVKITSNGPATLKCGDGSKTRIDGTKRVSFERYSLPVPCVYETNSGSKTLLQFSTTGEWACKETTGKVSCAEK